MKRVDPIIVALKAERKRLGLNQTQVGERIGRQTYQTIWQWENGANDPKLSNLRAWATALGMQIALTPADAAPVSGVADEPDERGEQRGA